MAIVSVTGSDIGQEIKRWSVPPDIQLNKSPIPRGIRHYGGVVSIAALGAGDQTVVNITFTFPNSYIYMCKSFNLRFESDDAVLPEFENQGALIYNQVKYGADATFQLFSRGAAWYTTLNLASVIWRPEGTWRQWINGLDGDSLVLAVSDQSGDTSSAGDVFWSCEFWEYDAEQCLNWEVNVQQQLIGP